MEVAEVWDGLGLNLSSYQKERQDIYIRKLHFNKLGIICRGWDDSVGQLFTAYQIC
jgi:hypothetical protein